MVTVALDKHNSAFVLQGKVQSGGHRISKGNGVYSSVFSVFSSNVNHVIAFADSVDWGLGGGFFYHHCSSKSCFLLQLSKVFLIDMKALVLPWFA